jgi:hypothetical protein
MIKLQVISSNNQELIGEIVFYKNQIYIGKDSNEILISEDTIVHKHISLEIFPNGIFLYPNNNIDFYLINGKRAISYRKINIEDTFTIGTNKFKILAANFQEFISKNKIIEDKFITIIEEKPPFLDLLLSLEELSNEE